MFHYVFFLFSRILYLQSLYKNYKNMAIKIKKPLCKKVEKIAKSDKKTRIKEIKKKLK